MAIVSAWIAGLVVVFTVMLVTRNWLLRLLVWLVLSALIYAVDRWRQSRQRPWEQANREFSETGPGKWMAGIISILHPL
jgi:membrane protein implicated in regulation of membrane protease activity